MKKKQVSKLSGQSLDITKEHIENLKAVFPQVVKDGKVDFKALQLILGDCITPDNERYGLNWAGKMDCFRHIQEPTTATLKPVRKESVDFDNTQNIFIEGDNLQVLKTLQKTYHGKIKMIYIDPPYNTGNDTFIYPDRFQESKEDYLKRIGDKDVEGNLIRDGFFRKNSKDTGHFHSNWLSMMYPRLFLAKNLLRDDGVIFVSIDDNEVHNLRMVMNEIFGEENFFAQIIVQSNKRGQTYKQISKTHEYILIYTRNSEVEINEIEKTGAKDDLNLEDSIGRFNIRELRNRNPKFGKFNRPNLYFPIYVNPDIIDSDGFSPVSLAQSKECTVGVYPLNSEGKESCWRWGKDLVSDNIDKNTSKSNLVAKLKGNGKHNIYEKYRKSTYKAKSIWTETGIITEKGTVELGKLELSPYFDFPKPIFLLKKVLRLGVNSDDIILDFFAGSGTTADAVMSLNAEDGGNRKYICVQLPEPCEKDSEAFKAGYKTIADIGKERIRRAAKKIKKENEGKLDFDGGKLDLGFKVFKLDESNFKPWRSNIRTAKELKEQLSLFTDNVKPEALQDNILYELILKTGLDLNVKVEEKKANGKKYFVIEDDQLAICLEEKITKALIEKITKLKPEKFICLDRAFAGNDQLKTNTALQMESEKIEFKVI